MGIALVLLGGSAACAVHAADRPPVVVGVVRDGPNDRLRTLQEVYVRELIALCEADFDVQIRNVTADWTRAGIVRQMDALSADDSVDLVLVIGLVANQVVAGRERFSKPTFLPFLIDRSLVARAGEAGGSGVPNLNYLEAAADLRTDLLTFRRIVPYDNLAFIADETLVQAIPQLVQGSRALAASEGIEMLLITPDENDVLSPSAIPEQAEAVMIAGLPRMSEEAFAQLVATINELALPSYSLLGETAVEIGVLATNSAGQDNVRMARRNALNMQAVLLGERAQDQPTKFEERTQLTINLATARQIGLSPSFRVLASAILINENPARAGPELGLLEVAREAVEANLTLAARRLDVDVATQDVALARSDRLPGLSTGTSYTTRKRSPSVEAGLLPERSRDASLDVSQLVYADTVNANIVIQDQLLRTREESLRELRLDTILAATSAYYNSLAARSRLEVQKSNLDVTRANLQLARDRVRLGTSSSSDVFRWESSLANAQSSVIAARAVLEQTRDSLNRVLNRPLGTRPPLREANFNDPFLFSREEFDTLVESPADYAHFVGFVVDRALERAPEIAQLDAQIKAKRREFVSRKRAYWLPDVSVGGRYTNNLGQSGVGAGIGAGEDLDDWNISLQAQLPLYAGGARRAALARTRIEVAQLGMQRNALAQQIEERVRFDMHDTQARYAAIDLARAAAVASQRNYELVADAYAKGSVSVVDLLDAQASSLQARQDAAVSLYDFLLAIMNVQRSSGQFDFMLPRAEQQAVADELRRYLSDKP